MERWKEYQLKLPYARLFTETGVAFVHIPKNAGSSISLALYGTQVDHLTWAEIRELNPVMYGRWIKFAVVRDPISRFVSAYNYLMAGGINESDLQFAKEVLWEYEDLDKFVKSLLNREVLNQVFQHWHFRFQTEFVCTQAGRCMMDVLLPFERLDSSIRERLPLVGKLRGLPRLNVGAAPSPEILLGQESEEILRLLYAKDSLLHGAASTNAESYGLQVW